MRSKIFFLMLAVLSLAAAADAQVEGARELALGIPAKGIAGKPGQIDHYYFAGEAGSRQTFTYTGRGKAMLILYTPEGEEMLNAEGDGAVKLEAVLSWTDVYSVAVLRKEPVAYTLKRTATVPTLAEAKQATFVGYYSTFPGYANGKGTWKCWMIPGVQLKAIFPGGTVLTETLAADRKTVTRQRSYSKGELPGEQREFSIEGDDLYTYVTLPDGKHEKYYAPYSEKLFMHGQGEGAWRGYLCDGASKP